MIEVRRAGPWPRGPFHVDLDAIERSAIDAAAVADLERDAGLSIGFVRGMCSGAALAAAVAVDLIVAAPAALTWGLVNVVDADPQAGARRLGESIAAR